MEAHWVAAATLLYMTANAARMIAYVPQIRRLVGRDRRESVSAASWIIFAVANGSAVIYALVAQHNTVVALWSLANCAASLVVAMLAARRHHRSTDDGAVAFYSAPFSGDAGSPVIRRPPTRSRDDDVGHGRRVDATFLDAVTGHPRRPVELQFRPLDPAAVVRIRAARIEGAA